MVFVGLNVIFIFKCKCYYKVAAWIGYYQLLPDIIEYFLFMNFQVAKMYGNIACSMEIQNIETVAMKCFHN